MYNYFLVGIAVVLFGIHFLLNERFQKESGGGLYQAMVFNLAGSALGLPVLIIINKFSFEYTHFALLMAILFSANSFMYTLCALRAFEHVNLSVYSMLSMLGGMILPVIAGIVFFKEKMTFGICACVVIIIVALAISLNKGKKMGARGIAYCIGVFFFNGMSGVISKIYTSSPADKVSAAGYSILSAIVVFIISLVFVLFFFKKREKIGKKALLYGGIAGPLTKVANYLLLLALAVLPASVNYPFVTGGTIIVSTLTAYLTKQRPSLRDWLAVCLSFVGILILVLSPI